MVSLISGALDNGHGSVLLGQGGSQSLDHFFSLFSILGVHFLVGDDIFEINLSGDHVSGGHHVVQVNIFDKGLNGGALLDFFLAHFFGHLSGVSLQSGHQSMGVLSFLAFKWLP